MAEFFFGSLVVPNGFVGPVDVDFGEDVSAATVTLTLPAPVAAKTGAVIEGLPNRRRFMFSAADTRRIAPAQRCRFDLTYTDTTNLVMWGHFVVE